MDLVALQTRAVPIAALYDQYNSAAGRDPWGTGDLALGFVGDVGDLAKLVMAANGRREVPDALAKLGHELADCLWVVLVLADRFGVDLVSEFGRMTAEIEQQISPDSP